MTFIKTWNGLHGKGPSRSSPSMGHIPLDQPAPSPIQPGLEYFQGCGFHNKLSVQIEVEFHRERDTQELSPSGSPLPSRCSLCHSRRFPRSQIQCLHGNTSLSKAHPLAPSRLLFLKEGSAMRIPNPGSRPAAPLAARDESPGNAKSRRKPKTVTYDH